MNALLAGLLAATLSASPGDPPAAPRIDAMVPCGGQRGTEVTVQFRGRYLGDLQGLLLTGSGITVTNCAAGEKTDRCSVTLRLDADCPLGAHPLRLRTAAGLSNLLMFTVGALPEEREQQSSKTPQVVALGTTVNGELRAEQEDRFLIDVPADVDIVCEIESMRLGRATDLCLEVVDADGRVLAQADDTALGRKDPWLHFQVAAATRCEVRVRAAVPGDTTVSPYRLHLGQVPRPTGAVPCGGQPGETLQVELLGDVPAGTRATVQLPDDGEDLYAWFPEVQGQVAPTPIWLSVGGPPNCTGAAGDDGASPCAVPGAAHGVLATPGARATFRFAAKKGKPLELRVVARQLRSPLDPVLTIRTAAGRYLTTNDDANSADSALRFDPPADGDYLAVVSDLLGAGSAEHFFRLEISPRVRAAQLSMVVGRQDEPIVMIPRGGAGAALLKATDLDAAAALVVRGLPPGVTAEFGARAPGSNLMPLLLRAAADAPICGAMLQFDTAGDAPAAVDFAQAIALVVGRNNFAQLQTTLRELPIAVTDPAQFAVQVAAPTVPIVRGAPLQLPLELTHADGFSGSVRVRALYTPPGLSAGQATCSTRADKATLTLEASANAPLGTFPCALVASTRVDGGYQQLALPHLAVTIIAPLVRGELGKARTEQGKPASLRVGLTPGSTLVAPYQARLLALPRGVTAPTLDVAADATEVTFDLTVAADAARGRHRGVVLELLVPGEHGTLVHRFSGGELRIDAPLVTPPTTAAEVAR
ncbi:MAG: hypothetical protein H6838_10150 [Planctomycetes bacterium]|nr:hypothetical protein [Planctomycetota bacterium]